MSHHHYNNHNNHNQNYTNYAAKPQTMEAPVAPQVIKPTAPTEPEVIPDPVVNEENIEAPVEPVVKETIQEELPTINAPIIGVVSGCAKLRVRKAPNTDAEVLCELPVASEVSVYMEESTDDFYKVITEAGVEGFCMKKFINTTI